MQVTPKYVIADLIESLGTQRFLLLCLCAAFPMTSNGDFAVGPVQGDVFMSWQINNTDTSSDRFVVNSAGSTLIFYPASSVTGTVAAAFTNRVRDVGSVSLGNVSFTLLNLTEADASKYLYKIYPGIEVGGQVLVIAGKPNVSAMAMSSPDENKQYTLRCSAKSTSNPPGMGLTMHYQWKNEKDQIITARNRYSFSSDQSDLIINPLKKEDDGIFVCEAWEHVGAVSKSAPFSLTVNAEQGSKQCQSERERELELGLGLGLGFGIPIVITVIVVVIFIVTDYKYAYTLGLVLGIGLDVTFIVGCIIIASLISTGTASCNLELGLGFGLSSGILCLIAGIIAVIFIFFQFPLFKDIPNRVELGKGILTGLLVASVIVVIVVYLKYDKLKPEPRSIKPDNKPREPADKKTEEVRLEPTDKKSKTNNSGSSSAVSREHVQVQMEKKGFKSDEEERPTAVHTRTQNKFDPNTNSMQTNDRQQPVPPANTGFEDTPTFRRLPQPPQNIKDRNQRGISATIDDTSDLASETPRPNKLPPLTPKQTVQKEDASKEPKKKKKKKKKKDQMNVETPEEENGETDLMVN